MTMMYEKQESELILSTLDKGLHVLETLAQIDHPDGLSLTELSHVLGMHRTTLLRILTTLQARGFISRDRTTDRYQIGIRMLALSSALLCRLDIRQIARPALKALSADTQELVHLVVLDGGAVVTIERLEGTHTLSLRTELGERRPAYCTASGKVFLAYLPPAEAEAILVQGMPAVTMRTITTREAMDQQLAEVMRRGYAWDDEERVEGVRCVAAPVFGHEGDVIAAVSLACPSLRTPSERVWILGERVKEAAMAISQSMGYSDLVPHLPRAVERKSRTRKTTAESNSH